MLPAPLGWGSDSDSGFSMAVFLRLYHGPSAKGDGAVLRVGDPTVSGPALLKLAAAKLKLKPKGLLVVSVATGAPPDPPLRAGDALAVCTPAEADALRASRAPRRARRSAARGRARALLPPEVWKLVIDFGFSCSAARPNRTCAPGSKRRARDQWRDDRRRRALARAALLAHQRARARGARAPAGGRRRAPARRPAARAARGRRRRGRRGDSRGARAPRRRAAERRAASARAAPRASARPPPPPPPGASAAPPPPPPCRAALALATVCRTFTGAGASRELDLLGQWFWRAAEEASWVPYSAAASWDLEVAPA